MNTITEIGWGRFKFVRDNESSVSLTFCNSSPPSLDVRGEGVQ